ncbi:MAG: glutamate 5-kinase [bacterium]|nr:glutamate 5-kinase [bacterium]
MKRIIIKIGTNVLSKSDGTLDVAFLKHVADQIVSLRRKGLQVVVITSGAGGAGRSMISLQDIQSETVQKQVFAAIGQVKLMTTYAELFEKYGYHCAQVLATKEDFRDEQHYLNMQNCFEGLLLDNVIPIVNENDVVATTELLFTDNDELAGLIAKQLKADCLIILTSTDGILDADGVTVSHVDASNIEVVRGYIRPDTSTGGRGGMTSKFMVAKELSEKGISVYIVDGKRENILLDIINGEITGTHFVPQTEA